MGWWIVLECKWKTLLCSVGIAVYYVSQWIRMLVIIMLCEFGYLKDGS